MAAGLGIAAGAFAQNYANAMGLRSRLDAEKQQQEINAIKLQRERDFDEAQKEMADIHKNFLDTGYDFVNNKAYDAPTQGGITPPGAARPTNPYADTDRVNSYYDRITPLLERQAFAAGKGSEILNIRKTVEGLRKERYMERLGESLASIEAGDERGFSQLAGVYNLHPDGRKLKSGSFNEDGTIRLTYVDADGAEKQQVTTFEKLSNMARSALNLADTVKLRAQERQAAEDRKSRETVAGEDRKSRETVAGEDRKSRETVAGEDRKSRETVAGEDRKSRERISASDNSTRITVAREARITAENDPTRVAQREAADARTQQTRQSFFNDRFQVDPRFAPKPESDLKAIRQSERDAYTRDLTRWNNSTKLSRIATNIASLNNGVPLARIADITEQLQDGKVEVFQEESSGRRFVKHSGNKRIYLD